jgi:hypothetical protein
MAILLKYPGFLGGNVAAIIANSLNTTRFSPVINDKKPNPMTQQIGSLEIERHDRSADSQAAKLGGT